jgi:hypothetical protein
MKPVSEKVLGEVLTALEREADMDGLVTCTGTRIAEIVGHSQSTVSAAIHVLADRNTVAIEGRLPVKAASCLMLRLTEAAA